MLNYFLFITVIVACIICWPAPLTDGLPVQPPVLLKERSSHVAIVQTLDDEPTPPWMPKVPQLTRRSPSPWDTPADDDIPQKPGPTALPTRLAAVEWRERLRQQESEPNKTTTIGVQV